MNLEVIGGNMQNIYRKDNICNNYLNNYVKFSLRQNNLYLYNTIYNTSVILEGQNQYLKELLDNLINGIDNKKILNILSNISDKPKVLYEYLLQNFIIEWGLAW